MHPATALRSRFQELYPSAFASRIQPELPRISTGIEAIDHITGGIPFHRITEICGSGIASSGKRVVFTSLLATATREGRFCALIDASDRFDLRSAEASGVHLPHLLWVRCGTSPQKHSRLIQALKATDDLLQRNGFGVIVVDLGRIPEQTVRRISINEWFRYRSVVENLPTALVFVEQQPNAANCAELVLNLRTVGVDLSGTIFTSFHLKAEVLRNRERKSIHSVSKDFSIRAQWA